MNAGDYVQLRDGAGLLTTTRDFVDEVGVIISIEDRVALVLWPFDSHKSFHWTITNLVPAQREPWDIRIKVVHDLVQLQSESK